MPCWYRYNDDGYGEHADGAPFDGTGIGRAWPLLSGERAHYELDAGNRAGAEALLRTLGQSSNGSRLLPEQVWDAADLPDRELFFGKASGSACPLVWAHSEYIKLVRSLRDGKIFDQAPQTVKRYRLGKQKATHWEWRFNNKCRVVPAGKVLRIAVQAPVVVHWSKDGWQTAEDVQGRDTGLGLWVADLPTDKMDAGHNVVFTFFWLDVQRWENVDFSVNIQD